MEPKQETMGSKDPTPWRLVSFQNPRAPAHRLPCLWDQRHPGTWQASHFPTGRPRSRFLLLSLCWTKHSAPWKPQDCRLLFQASFHSWGPHSLEILRSDSAPRGWNPTTLPLPLFFTFISVSLQKFPTLAKGLIVSCALAHVHFFSLCTNSFFFYFHSCYTVFEVNNFKTRGKTLGEQE